MKGEHAIRTVTTPPKGVGPHFAVSDAVRSAHQQAAVTVAVVIVHYNSGAHLLRCLEAVARQTRRPERVLVIDNGSSDDAAAQVAERFPDVELHWLETNLGFAAANNRAIAICTDVTWLALLNADAFAEPDWLARLAAAAEQADERCAALGSLMLCDARPELLDGAGDAYHASGFAFRKHCGDPRSAVELQSEEICTACAAAALYRRSAVVAVGGFDERYFCYFEDVDLGLRLRLAGYGARLVPKAIVRHVGSASVGRHSDFTVYHAHRNLVWTWWKCLPASLLLRWLPQHLLLQLLSLGGFMLRGQGRVILRAKWHALLGLPRILRERRTIHAARRVSPQALRRHLLTAWRTPYRRRRDGCE